VAPKFEDLTPLAAAYLAPVPGPSPAGASARLDPEYQAVAAEVAKLGGLAGSPVDWGLVERGASRLLRSTTKDLPLAAYLAQALHATRGLDGLTIGTVLLAGLLDGYWDTLQPDAKRMRGRANALYWFLERAVPALEAMPEGSASAAQTEALEVASVRLAEVTRQRLGDAAPAFGSFLQALARLRPVVEAKSPPGPSTQASPQATTREASDPDSPPTLPSSGGDPREVLEKIGAMLVELASRMRESSPTDPAGYRAARVGLWLHVDTSPVGPGGRSTIPAPPAALLPRLALLAENQKWASLLEETESSLPRQRFALDLQWHSWLALQGLGTDYDRARAAVASELRGLLARMPGLPTSSFSDGTGLAAAPTRAWIDEVVLARPVPVRDPGRAEEGAPPAYEHARRKFAEGRIAEALEGFQAAIQQLPGGRARFLLRLEVARAYAGGGLTSLALAAYQGLDAEARAHDLGVWEPALAVDTLKGLIATLRALVKDSSGTSTQLGEYYSRLCSLDPAAAFEVWP
jgi:type VI secretion system protein VasJ